MTSDPNMPSSEGPEESGLMSDSTYEVINNTDTESQDDFPAGSVCSSDYLHGDDVHSLISTEYTGDGHDDDDDHDDGHHSDASEGVVLPSQVQEASAEQSRYASDEAENTDSDSEEGHIREEPSDRARLHESRDRDDIAASDATLLQKSPDDEKNRTSALQYAEKSLETPSASMHVDKDEDHSWLATARDMYSLVDRSMASGWGIASTFGFILAFGCVCAILQSYLAPASKSTTTIIPEPPVEVRTTVSVMTSTRIIDYTSTKTILISETRTATPLAATTSRATPLLASSQAHREHEKKTDGKGVCSAETYSPQEILIRMPHDTKLYWLAKDSISIELTRGDEPIKAKFSSVDEGILIEVPKSHAHGVVNVSVTTTRRPKVNETFAVDFGEGIINEALDLGKLIAQDFANMWAVASAESLRRALQVKEAASEVQHTLENRLGAASKEAKRMLHQAPLLRFSPLADLLPEPPMHVSQLLQWWERRAKQTEDSMEISLLRAQIRAKALWLQMTASKEAHDKFVRKGEEFVMEKAAEKMLKTVEREVRAEDARRQRMEWGPFAGGRRGCLPWARGRDCLDA